MGQADAKYGGIHQVDYEEMKRSMMWASYSQRQSVLNVEMKRKESEKLNAAMMYMDGVATCGEMVMGMHGTGYCAVDDDNRDFQKVRVGLVNLGGIGEESLLFDCLACFFLFEHFETNHQVPQHRRHHECCQWCQVHEVLKG